MATDALAAEALLEEQTGSGSFENLVKAAELYMRAASRTSNKAEAARFRRRCQELIAQAEWLRPQLDASRPTAEDIEILQKSSRLHGSLFPPWTTEPPSSDFEATACCEAFRDKTSFTMSEAQAGLLMRWCRPQELLKSQSDITPAELDSMMTTTLSNDLVQDVTADCSVVASLSAAMNVLTGRRAILSSIVYPFDKAQGRPRVSLTGKYIMRLYFNGCHRQVVIDDRLPASRTGRTLFVVDRANPQLLWPALLEKAYLKVRGGYDFPGSNSGTDLWIMMGWIPEQIFFQREELDVYELWKQVKSAYDAHDVVITLGTGTVSTEEENLTGLVGEHDYAVQDLKVDGENRMLLIKNPWCEGAVWKGRSWPLTPNDTGNSLSQYQGDRQPSDGSVWMTLEDVAQHFKSMYLNWNPGMFAHRLERHFHWMLPPSHLLTCLVENPQFSLASTCGTLVWLVFSRHFMDAGLATSQVDQAPIRTEADKLGFMGILLFDNNGRRVDLDEERVFGTPYVDSPQVFAKLEIAGGKSYTVVLDQQNLPRERYTFTLSAFSSQPLRIGQAVSSMAHTQSLVAAWTRRTAGGNASCTTYFQNPQFRLSISRSSPISILLSAGTREIHVRIDLVWSQGRRVSSVRQKDFLASSGEYKFGCAVLRLPTIAPGEYTIVCSAFEANQFAAFSIRVSSEAPISFSVVPPDAAGQLRTHLPSLQVSGGEQKHRASLSVARLTKVVVAARGFSPSKQLQASRKSCGPLLRISIVVGRGANSSPLAITSDGNFEDCIEAIRTPQFDLYPVNAQQDGAWILVESIIPFDCTGSVEADVFSDASLKLGPWELID